METKAVDPGYSSYGDLAVTKSGLVLCFYSRGDAGSDFGGYTFKALTLARFNLEWLTDGRDSLPSAP